MQIRRRVGLSPEGDRGRYELFVSQGDGECVCLMWCVRGGTVGDVDDMDVVDRVDVVDGHGRTRGTRT